MEYTEELAKELAARHEVPAATVRTWKTRGRIPDKYAAEKLPDAVSTAKDKQALADIRRALSTGKFNLNELGSLAGVSRFRIQDISRGKSPGTVEDIAALRKAINVVRNDAKKALEVLQKPHANEDDINIVRNFFKRPEVVVFVLLDRNRALQNLVSPFMHGHRGYPQETAKTLAGLLMVFITETTIN